MAILDPNLNQIHKSEWALWMKKSQLNIHKKINLAPNSLDCLFFFFVHTWTFIQSWKKKKKELSYNDDYGGMIQDYVPPYKKLYAYPKKKRVSL